jgi:NADPH-dependent 2,4-dienoyl-CoA reductase/sulfur reductase-like enzyme
MKIIKTAFYVKIALGLVASVFSQQVAEASLPRTTDTQETCDILVFGGGLAGAATAYEALLAGRTVCLTDITDWVGGSNFLPGNLGFG